VAGLWDLFVEVFEFIVEVLDLVDRGPWVQRWGLWPSRSRSLSSTLRSST